MIGNIARSTSPSWFHLGQRVKLLCSWSTWSKIKLLIVQVTHHLIRVLLLAQRLGRIQQSKASSVWFGPKGWIFARTLFSCLWTRGGQLTLVWWRSTTCAQICVRRVMPRNCTAIVRWFVSKRGPSLVLVYDAFHQIMNVFLVHKRSRRWFWLQIIPLYLLERIIRVIRLG